MIIFVIVSAIILGWFVGNIILDEWVNESNDEINEDINSSNIH